jgi:hypothetical protein
MNYHRNKDPNYLHTTVFRAITRGVQNYLNPFLTNKLSESLRSSARPTMI